MMNYEYRIIVLGSNGVGKSSLIIQFTEEIFIDEYDPTFEESFRKLVNFNNNPYELTIFDSDSTCGQYNVRDCRTRASKGVIFVYSISCRDSFNIIEVYIEQNLRVKDVEKIPMIIIGNKCDLEEERKISFKEGEDLAKQYECLFYETSAKENYNVTEPFHNILHEIIKQENNNTRNTYNTIK